MTCAAPSQEQNRAFGKELLDGLAEVDREVFQFDKRGPVKTPTAGLSANNSIAFVTSRPELSTRDSPLGVASLLSPISPEYRIGRGDTQPLQAGELGVALDDGLVRSGQLLAHATQARGEAGRSSVESAQRSCGPGSSPYASHDGK